LAVAKGLLYASLGHRYLFAYDRSTGVERWEANTGSYSGRSNAVAVADGDLYALNSRTGKQLLNLPLGAGGVRASSLAVSQGTVYLPGANLVALRLPPG